MSSGLVAEVTLHTCLNLCNMCSSYAHNNDHYLIDFTRNNTNNSKIKLLGIFEMESAVY